MEMAPWPGKARRAADDRAIVDTGGRILRAIGIGGGVGALLARLLREMIDGEIVGIERALGVGTDRRVLIAKIQPQCLLFAPVQRRDGDPEIGDPRGGVVTFDMKRKRRLVVAVDEADIRAVLHCVREGEVTAGQLHQHYGATDLAGDVETAGAGVDCYHLAIFPVLVPPGVGRGRHDHRRKQQCQHHTQLAHGFTSHPQISRPHQNSPFAENVVRISFLRVVAPFQIGKPTASSPEI